ncbi:YhjD/YihY/BrkB family envelope integrity protein [Conexibacter woesei]|uniref:YhjD/YihY/BrkB family envelope integrity protein n=1 Tax=Conexibacter woesei TaxID=191495 RepID=UPI000419E9A0|nr:YhjD/YihY/BrkB family envelope integrity protein [Conexibacter woesei]
MRRPHPRRWSFGDMLTWGRGLVARLISLEILDRALVIGAQAFGALIPLLIVIAGTGATDEQSFADTLIDRFDLTGSTADSVKQAFGNGTGGASLTTLGVVIVIFSSLSFTRAVQRTFELTWELPKRGFRSTGWNLAWVAAFAAYLTIFPVVRGWFHGWPYNVISLCGTFLLWSITPYLLLARRVRWKRLVPQAALTAFGMTLLSAGLLIYMPRALSSASSQFGAIGIAFTLLTMLWALGFVLVTAAAVGAYIANTTWLGSSGSVTQPSSSKSPARAS